MAQRRSREAYKKEIRELLIVKGHIDGFNTLLELGKFHTTTLQFVLEEMLKDRQIKIEKIGMVKRYTLIKRDFDEILKRDFDENFKDLDDEKNEINLTESENTLVVGNMTRNLFHRYTELLVGRLFEKFVRSDDQEKEFIEKAMKDYWLKIEDSVRSLRKEDRADILDSLFTSSPHIISLSEYRKISKKIVNPKRDILMHGK